MTIVVTGGSGFIGTILCKRLLEEKHTVIVVAKRAPAFTHKQLFFIQCDLEIQPLPYDILERTDAIIHLVGVSPYQKWKKGIKEAIRTSRIESTKHLVESIKNTTNRPPVLICASSTYYYGATVQKTTEDSPQGAGYLAEMVHEWEQEAQRAEDVGVRVVCLRTAPVFGHGGLLSFFEQLSKTHLFWKLSKENFVMSWVHEDDVVNAYLFVLEANTLHGVVNLAAPQPFTGNDFIEQLATLKHRVLLGVMPKKIQKLLFGELYSELIKNQNIIPERLLDKGFVFQYSDGVQALHALNHENETN